MPESKEDAETVGNDIPGEETAPSEEGGEALPDTAGAEDQADEEEPDGETIPDEPAESDEDSEYDPEVVVEDAGSFRSEIVIYQTSDGSVALDVPLENDTVWLTQKQMQELFGRDISGISRHISNVFKDGEVEKDGNVHYVRSERTGKPIAYYSLDVIIPVGYRVRSKRAVEFRKWATKVLKEIGRASCRERV